MYNIFNKTTLISDYINRLVSTFNFPIYKSVSDGDYIVNRCIYVYRRYIIKCTKSGYLNKAPYCKFDILSDYIYNENYPKYTYKFLSNTNYYNEATHIALGNYLRIIRDYFNINLMPFYNCIGDAYTFKFDITQNSVEKSNGVKILKVPINFNTKYTFAVDCYGTSYIKPVIMDKFEILNEDLSNSLKGFKYSGLSFKSPITFEIDLSTYNNKEQLALKEKDLYLLIKLPKYESSMVLLEGDYTNIKKYVVDDYRFLEYSPQEINNKLVTQLSLLLFNDGTTYSFSNRLIEYLVNNVITYTNTYDIALQKLQEAIGKSNDNTYEGIFNDMLRKIIYDDFILSNDRYKVDQNGFIDKDIEFDIMRNK